MYRGLGASARFAALVAGHFGGFVAAARQRTEREQSIGARCKPIKLAGSS
jgi:hypothetical protein